MATRYTNSNGASFDLRSRCCATEAHSTLQLLLTISSHHIDAANMFDIRRLALVSTRASIHNSNIFNTAGQPLQPHHDALVPRVKCAHMIITARAYPRTHEDSTPIPWHRLTVYLSGFQPYFPTICSSTADMIAGLRLKEFPKSVSTTWVVHTPYHDRRGKEHGANSVHHHQLIPDGDTQRLRTTTVHTVSSFG